MVLSQSSDFSFSNDPVGPATPTLFIKASIFFVFLFIFLNKSET